MVRDYESIDDRHYNIVMDLPTDAEVEYDMKNADSIENRMDKHFKELDEITSKRFEDLNEVIHLKQEELFVLKNIVRINKKIKKEADKWQIEY